MYRTQPRKIMLTLKRNISQDLFNKTFLIRTDCKAAPSVLKNDVKNIHIKGESNALPDFLTREFLQ
ncbi:hypothetical protein S83_032614, partial [Arachis hypogaea]